MRLLSGNQGTSFDVAYAVYIVCRLLLRGLLRMGMCYYGLSAQGNDSEKPEEMFLNVHDE